MPVTAILKYSCGGCDKTEEVQVPRLGSRFHGISGGESGVGRWVNERADAEAHCPEGWMAFDPYTRCTYCPDCVEAIWPDPEERHGIKVVIAPADPEAGEMSNTDGLGG